jgi:hypothetical protein
MTTIGFIGSGHIGSQVARVAIAAGHEVVLSNSRGPETLAELVAELGDAARAATSAEAAAAGEVVVVTIPFKHYLDVPVEPLAGKVVIDTNNYYWERDGHYPELDDESLTSAELLQVHLPTSRVVKVFNNVYAHEITATRLPPLGEWAGPGRRAVSIAGDDAAAKGVVTDLLDGFGFDTVDAGPLAEGWRYQRDEPAYGPATDGAGLTELLAAATRYRDR